jgi:hypothetical protein
VLTLIYNIISIIISSNWDLKPKSKNKEEDSDGYDKDADTTSASEDDLFKLYRKTVKRKNPITPTKPYKIEPNPITTTPAYKHIVDLEADEVLYIICN